MAQLAFDRSGAGEPLVLLHPLGSSRRIWDPVVPALAEHFDVIAVDLPGFGDSAPLPAGTVPLPATVAAAVAGLLDELGVAVPHVAGNSLGGWVALELAGLRRTASLTLLSPAGLWARTTPLYCLISLRVSRALARHATGLLLRAVGYRLGRAIVLSQTHGRPLRMAAANARAAVRALGTSPGFDATLRATVDRRFVASEPIDVPLTVAFGSRDVLLLPHQSRHLDQLPAGTRIETVPFGGHFPVADNPAGVTALIRRTAALAQSSPLR